MAWSIILKLYKPFSGAIKCFHKWQRDTGWQEKHLSYSNSVKLAYFTLLPFKTHWYQGAEGYSNDPGPRFYKELAII